MANSGLAKCGRDPPVTPPPFINPSFLTPPPLPFGPFEVQFGLFVINTTFHGSQSQVCVGRRFAAGGVAHDFARSTPPSVKWDKPIPTTKPGVSKQEQPGQWEDTRGEVEATRSDFDTATSFPRAQSSGEVEDGARHFGRRTTRHRPQSRQRSRRPRLKHKNARVEHARQAVVRLGMRSTKQLQSSKSRRRCWQMG